MLKHEAFIDEFIKESGISDALRRWGMHPAEIASDAIKNVATLAKDPKGVISENAKFMWDPPKPGPNASLADKVFTNKWLQRYLGYVLPAQAAYNLATTPGASSDLENWGTLAGQTAGAFAVPLRGTSLGGALATQIGLTEAGKMLGRKAKQLLGSKSSATKQIETIENKYPQSQQKVY